MQNKKLAHSDAEKVDQMIRDQYKLHIQRIFSDILDEPQGKTSLIARAKPYEIKQLLEHFREALIDDVSNPRPLGRGYTPLFYALDFSCASTGSTLSFTEINPLT